MVTAKPCPFFRSLLHDKLTRQIFASEQLEYWLRINKPCQPQPATDCHGYDGLARIITIRADPVYTIPCPSVFLFKVQPRFLYWSRPWIGKDERNRPKYVHPPDYVIQIKLSKDIVCATSCDLQETGICR